MRNFLAVLIMSTVLLSCGQSMFAPHVSVAAALSTQVRQGVRTVRISELTDFKWERMYVFGPYMPAPEVNKVLGFDWRDYKSFGLDSSDHFYLMVFVDENRVVRAEQYFRREGDFESGVLNRAFTPKSGVFDVKFERGLPVYSSGRA